MKIELNPEHMTVSELNDCIAELTAQRDHIIEENRAAAQTEVNLMLLQFIDDLQPYYEEGYDLTLNAEYKNSRNRSLSLNLSSIKHLYINVNHCSTDDKAES